MVSGLFGTLLQEVSEQLKLDPILKPDARESCLVRFKGGIDVQMEINGKKDCFVMGTSLGVIAPGKYREEVFQAALRENGERHEIAATFAFSPRINQLYIYKELPLNELRGSIIAEKLELFVGKALHWKEALDKSLVPEVKEVSKGTSIFQMSK